MGGGFRRNTPPYSLAVSLPLPRFAVKEIFQQPRPFIRLVENSDKMDTAPLPRAKRAKKKLILKSRPLIPFRRLAGTTPRCRRTPPRAPLGRPSRNRHRVPTAAMESPCSRSACVASRRGIISVILLPRSGGANGGMPKLPASSILHRPVVSCEPRGALAKDEGWVPEWE